MKISPATSLNIKCFDANQSYQDIFLQMKEFTINRTEQTQDALWLLEHDPVFTQGQAGKAEHLLFPGDIPVIQSDRGGQVTFHGPGQLMIYVLWDLKRLQLGIKQLVCELESFVISLLNTYQIEAHRIPKAPGIYVANKKIASIGLRVKKGSCYHGISLNVSMDLSPFSRINPCGFKNLEMTQISDFNPDINITTVQQNIAELIQQWHAQRVLDVEQEILT